MASNAQLAITKASLLAALLKPTPDADLPACSRTDIEALHGLLSAAAARCSPANVQVWNHHTADSHCCQQLLLPSSRFPAA